MRIITNTLGRNQIRRGMNVRSTKTIKTKRFRNNKNKNKNNPKSKKKSNGLQGWKSHMEVIERIWT